MSIEQEVIEGKVPEWFPMPTLPMPILYEYYLLIKHRYGIDAIYFHGGEWKFWYSGNPLGKLQANDIFTTATHFMATHPLK